MHDLDLTEEALIQAVFAANRRTIVSGFQFSLRDHLDPAKASRPSLASHAAQEQGNAVADVIFGDYNPSGRLTQTWPKSVDQLPPFEDYDIRKGRTYMALLDRTALSIRSRLELHDVRLLKSSIQCIPPGRGRDDHGQGGCHQHRLPKRPEVVQLYVSHIGSKVPRPRKELKGFERVLLRPSEPRPSRYRSGQKNWLIGTMSTPAGSWSRAP